MPVLSAESDCAEACAAPAAGDPGRADAVTCRLVGGAGSARGQAREALVLGASARCQALGKH